MTTTFQKTNSTKCTNFEVSSLGLELQVSSLGVSDEVSVSSRNFNQVSVSTTSLMKLLAAVLSLSPFCSYSVSLVSMQISEPC